MSAPDNIIAAAVDYAQRGWSVIPVRADKRPAVLSWKNSQHFATEPGAVAAWFGRVKGAAGVGIVLGAVSGDIYARDFDIASAYEGWARAFPELARALPTVRTSRGFHVYARWKGVRTATLPDGELRGEGAYVVAPPSQNGTAAIYAWLVPLPAGELTEVDPGAAGLDRAWIAESKAGATERTERTETTETPEGTETTEDTEDTEDDEAIRARWCEKTHVAIESAIVRTLPPAHGKRNAHLFRLARALKSIPALANLPAHRVRVLRPYVHDWYKRALPTMITKEFCTTWGDFAHGWARVRHAEGEDVLGAAMEAAEAALAPSWASDYSPSCKLLASLCRELQRRAGSDPFFLSAIKAGECVGVDKGTAYRWLTAFVADGALRIEVLGSAQSGRATRYRYIAGDLGEPAHPAPAA